MLQLGETARAVFWTFFIAATGYGIGRIRIRGIGLGSAGIFIAGLVFGHFGVRLPNELQTVGLVLFITSVGFSAGPGFAERLKRDGLKYAVLCLTTTAAGAAVCCAAIRWSGLEAPLASGLMTGAFTTSPGFAAAKEAAGAQAAQVAAGYGIAYPVGVLVKVLFIQIVPNALHVNMEEERRLIALPAKKERGQETCRPLFQMDALGLCSFSLAACLGMLLGAVAVPLPGGSRFSLGSVGGPLLTGLLFGGMGRIGCVNLRTDPSVTGPAKELGLLLFFASAGAEGGRDVAKVLASCGLVPLLYSFLMVAVPLAAGFWMFRRVLKLPLLNGLSSMTAGMTCTPSLAVLTQMAKTDDVAAAYATTYPLALISLILTVQMLVKF